MITRGFATDSIITRGFIFEIVPYIRNVICTFSKALSEYVFFRKKQKVVFTRWP